MSPKEAKRVLELLAQGVDPTTGEVLPPEHVLSSPSAIRALFLGAMALDTLPNKASRTGTAFQAGKPWTQEEEQRLLAAFDKGDSVEQMSLTHGRSKGGIISRLVRLGKTDERLAIYSPEHRCDPADD